MKSILSYLTAIVAAVLLSSCGRVIEQDHIALVIKNLGARSAESPNMKLVWADRCDWDPSGKTQQIYEFPLGLQTYEMTAKPSYESPNDESFQLDCVGGKVKVDVLVQLYLDRHAPELDKKLFAFLGDHQLRIYAGEQNMLAKWAAAKLRNIIRAPLSQYCLEKQMIEVMRSKAEINEKLLKAMNERFGKYGIVFTKVAISSPVDPVARESRVGLEKVVKAEYQKKLLDRQEQGLTPLTTQIAQKKEEGETAVQAALSTSRGEASTMIAEAQQKRATRLTATIGKENYAKLEEMVRLTDGLKESETSIELMPSSLSAILGAGAQPAPAPKK